MKRFTPRRAMWAVTLAAVSMAAYVNVDVGSNDAGSFFLLHSVGFTAAVTSITFLLTDNSGARFACASPIIAFGTLLVR